MTWNKFHVEVQQILGAISKFSAMTTWNLGFVHFCPKVKLWFVGENDVDVLSCWSTCTNCMNLATKPSHPVWHSSDPTVAFKQKSIYRFCVLFIFLLYILAKFIMQNFMNLQWGEYYSIAETLQMLCLYCRFVGVLRWLLIASGYWCKRDKNVEKQYHISHECTM